MSLIHFPEGAVPIGITLMQAMGLGAGAGELTGQNAGYSKFSKGVGFKVPSRLGMLILYAPSFAVALSMLQKKATPGNGREFLTASLLATHFGKRLLECSFLHKYSGSMDGDAVIPIPIYYALVTYFIGWRQRQISEYSHPKSELLLSAGLGLFAVGQLGNLYHHWILATLRKEGQQTSSGAKAYVIPSAGLFKLVTAPHYFCELVAWLGLACVTQELNSFLVFGSMLSYLGGRAVATTRWYRTQFDNYPARKHLIPFLF